ncbi:hypothetical protein [uncultured Tateyamaria sp.]|uniref:hypothetical protein n=1 Tax=uncultured Tateyamaria sp. TaxID=455651 RepID=UPI0026026986|nr:hypothetical protein [uncultured Tateyamaria sp.]
MAIAELIFAPIAHFRGKLKTHRMQMAHDGVMQPVHAPKPMPLPAPTRAKSGLTIPCPDPTAEERARDVHQVRGQKLARLEDWEKLTDEIATADANRVKTPGGMPVAEILAFGARSDVVSAAEHALMNGRPAHDAPLMAGIEALEHVLSEHPENPVLAAIVALAHVDLGWAWRGTAWKIEVPARNLEAFSAHFDRAASILSDFDAAALDSPLIAAAHCALCAGRTEPTRKVARRFETWIDLDPRNARCYRAFGAQMLPRWNGSHEQLELEARRTAGRTHDIWGAGGYAWTMFDAISSDTTACAQVDLEFFLDGLRDILRNSNDQHTVNLLLAYCANTMGATQTGNDEADYTRAQIGQAADWIVRDHLTELHPMLWAHAARGFDNALRVRCPDRFAASGHSDAMHFLRTLFRNELAAGYEVLFTKHGFETRAS